MPFEVKSTTFGGQGIGLSEKVWQNKKGIFDIHDFRKHRRERKDGQERTQEDEIWEKNGGRQRSARVGGITKTSGE